MVGSSLSRRLLNMKSDALLSRFEQTTISDSPWTSFPKRAKSLHVDLRGVLSSRGTLPAALDVGGTGGIHEGVDWMNDSLFGCRLGTVGNCAREWRWNAFSSGFAIFDPPTTLSRLQPGGYKIVSCVSANSSALGWVSASSRILILSLGIETARRARGGGFSEL